MEVTLKDTCKGPWVTVLLTALLASGSPLLMGQGFTSREEAMKVFAQLLKISPDHPDVKVNVRRIEEREGLRIEDISWTSLDGQEPLAYVVRPALAPDRLPAIICLHGSSGSRDSMVTEEFGWGKWIRYGNETSHERLLGWARELARQGYLILALTQRGLDRRTPDTNDQSKEMLVRGRTLMGAIVFEIRQALTYLQKRQDVDPDRLGMTGMSFGGITTFYSWLVDDRITAAASICGGVGSVGEFVETGSRGYHGFYWWIPDMLTQGDQGDFAAAMAPRPLMLWAPLDDIGMPKEGVDRFLSEAYPAYYETGHSENLLVLRPPGKHQFTLEAFKAMKEFFDEYLLK